MSDIQIIQGDCLEVMRTFSDNQFDLVFCSPPYEDARTYGIDYKLSGQDWVDWAKVRFMECCRISKGLVAWVVEGRTRKFQYSCTPLLLAADLHRAGIKLRKPPVFHRVGIPGSGGPDWLRNDYEFIICASKGKLPWSNNTAMGHPPKWAPGGEMSHRLVSGERRNQWGGTPKTTGGSRKQDGELKHEERPSHIFTKKGTRWRPDCSREEQIYMPPVKANPGNVIKCKVGGGLMGSPLAHENEAPFPETLVEFFVRSFCPPGGWVLDPFSGSGTTAATALKNGRNCIGIDLRESQVALSLRREQEARQYIQEEKDKMGLFANIQGA